MAFRQIPFDLIKRRHSVQSHSDISTMVRQKLQRESPYVSVNTGRCSAGILHGAKNTKSCNASPLRDPYRQGVTQRKNGNAMVYTSTTGREWLAITASKRREIEKLARRHTENDQENTLVVIKCSNVNRLRDPYRQGVTYRYICSVNTRI